MPTVRAYIGLGANVGDARRTLVAAVHALDALPRARVAGVSRLYVTSPVGVRDQPDFLNAVVALDVPANRGGGAGPIALLLALKSIERAFGRRERYRHGPRELDLDLLLFGDEQVTVERPPDGLSLDPAKAAAVRFLEIPHSQARRRLFEALAEGEAAARAIADWDVETGDWVD
jgi:2-amino-4-hydroxy-6-hydroxymethyldihydropteridine diphosphokinase